MVVQHSGRRLAGARRALLLSVLLSGLAACGGGGGGTEPDPAERLSAQSVVAATTRLAAVQAEPAYAALLDAFALTTGAMLSVTPPPTARAGRVLAARAVARHRAALPSAGLASAVVVMLDVRDPLKGNTYVRDPVRGWVVDPGAPAVAAGVVRFIIPNLANIKAGTLDVTEKTPPALNTTSYQAVLTNLANAKVVDLAVTDTRTAAGFTWTVRGTVTDGATAIDVDESLSFTGQGSSNERLTWHVEESVPSLGLSIDWMLTAADNNNGVDSDDSIVDDLSVTLDNTTVREVYEYPADEITAYVDGSLYATATSTGTNGDWTFRTADGKNVSAAVADMLNRVQDLFSSAPTGTEAVLSVDYLVAQPE